MGRVVLHARVVRHDPTCDFIGGGASVSPPRSLASSIATPATTEELAAYRDRAGARRGREEVAHRPLDPRPGEPAAARGEDCVWAVRLLGASSFGAVCLGFRLEGYSGSLDGVARRRPKAWGAGRLERCSEIVVPGSDLDETWRRRRPLFLRGIRCSGPRSS